MQGHKNDTIAAISTGQGQAAIAVIRLSGPAAISIVEKYFRTPGMKPKSLQAADSHRVLFGLLANNEQVIDEVVVSLFRGPHSYTGEDTIEVSCHGSTFIQQQLLQLFLGTGARLAEPGEFTMRAFLNGRMDLSQAEAVADLIASDSGISHHFAMQQMRGGFSKKIQALRQQLVNFASLIELELDFSEEDVEFADRSQLRILVTDIITNLRQLLKSFETGIVLKNGVPVTIAGKPNAGKSTLLNVLLDDERAIVSDIPGTTRDIIEDETVIGGVRFRFMDTAGLRHTTDVIEKIGVERAMESIRKSAIIIYLFDASVTTLADVEQEIKSLDLPAKGKLVLVANKADSVDQNELKKEFGSGQVIIISAKNQNNISELRSRLLELSGSGEIQRSDTVVTNARHAAALSNALEALQKVGKGLDTNLAGDFLALDIRFALEELGNITGEVTNEDLLTNIFTRFCIGK